MLCWITIFGGVLIMMGQHSRSEALFYYFRLEDQVPENHLLRLIEKHISFAFVREKLKESYSETGRPSIDPELLLRILLIGYLYGVTSERKLIEELRMHLAFFANNRKVPICRLSGQWSRICPRPIMMRQQSLQGTIRKFSSVNALWRSQ